MRKLFQASMAALCLYLWPTLSLARLTTTPEIIAHTISAIPACMQWVPVLGICFWLTCTPLGCYITTSTMAGNYNPDLVVTAYHQVGDTPWLEAKLLYGALQKAAGQAVVSALLPGVPFEGGDRAEETRSRRDHKNLVYKEVDAIGHPLDAITEALAQGTGLICPSETRPMYPYLLTGLDVPAWRFAIPEIIYPESLIPGLREIGYWPLNTWGAVYPRTGFVTQSENPKAGAVAAQRAGDVVTRPGQPHVYFWTKMTAEPGPVFVIPGWPGPLWETQWWTGYWQMLGPLTEFSCDVFGINDTLWLGSWADFKVDQPKGDYAWNLWRPYKCCLQAGEQFIGYVQFVPWPLPP